MNIQILTDKVLKFFSDDSNFCVQNGLDHNLGSLPDPGKNKLIKKQGQLRLLTRLLDQFDKTTLSNDEIIDFKLIELLIERENVKYELEIDGVLEIFKKPIANITIFDPIYTLLINDNREPKYRLVNIVSRIKAIPDYLLSMQRNINKPVKRWVEIEKEALLSFDDLFGTVLSFASENEFKGMMLLEDYIAKAKVAKDRYVNFLNVCEVTTNIHLGEEQAKRVIKSNGIDLSIEEISKMAKNFVILNKNEMSHYKKLVIEKYQLIPNISDLDVQKFLNEKFKVDDVLSEFEKEEKSLIEFLKEKKLVDLSFDEEVQIIRTPDFMTGLIPAGAMCPPLALRDGIKRSLIFLTIDDENSSDHNKLTIPPMMIHEAYPGHHLQFSYAAKNKSVIRRIFQANDLSEGWATYLEEYLLEIGYKPENRAEMQYLIKRDIARIAARVAIDLYFMIGDKKYLDLGLNLDFSSSDPFENAKKLLIQVTGFSSQRADGELNWYSMERGYPMTYLIGNQLLLKLKNESKLSDFDFHQKVLSQGNMPLSLLKL